MSFSIHAAGVGRGGGFVYTRRNCADGDIFEAAAIMSALRSSSPTRVGAAEGVASYTVPSESSARMDGIRGIARMEFIHLLQNGVGMLASCEGARQGWLSVTANQSHIAWPATNRIARYNFLPGVNSACEFMQTMMPVLTGTEMNNYGVLRGLAMALNGYYYNIGTTGRPMLLVQLNS